MDHDLNSFLRGPSLRVYIKMTLFVSFAALWYMQLNKTTTKRKPVDAHA